MKNLSRLKTKDYLLTTIFLLISNISFAQWFYQDNPYFNSGLGFQSVHLVDANNGWAIGDFGCSVKYDGQQWVKQNSNSTDYFNSVHFSDKNNGWAVGYSISPPRSSILRYKNNQWIPQPKITDYDLRSVYFTDSINGWILGKKFNKDSIILSHYNGDKWTSTILSFKYGLYSLYFTDKNHGWAVGGGGSSLYGMILKGNGILLNII